ncbi:MAG TPA: chemotaxis protein CheB, partial [Thermodesulfovibrionales bacterium]|nr:chemotaxis protein CheB [Thermodesulfovibrionales bacterium]
MSENSGRSETFPIVAIGASAGGLNALECFVGELPRGFGFAVVFVQHLSTKHKNLLADLVAKRRPDLDVVEITDGLKLLPSKIFICPPGKDVSIREGVFCVATPAKEHLHFQIDEFLTSLAAEARERSVAVIFSGSGVDGARGICSIKEAGGTVFVQEPETAEFPSMPAAAIKTGLADEVLPPTEIALEILRLQETALAVSEKDITPAQFEAIFRQVREKTGYSFVHYKKSVVGRRVRRRMYLHGLTSVQEYIEMLSQKDSEPTGLATDLMIGVTSFFRDRLAWKALRSEVVSKIAAEESDVPVRVWTPASATGEEAFSIAMMLRYELDLAGRKRAVQVFATDLNDAALEKAREGKYPGSISADVPPEYIKKFFTYTEDSLSAVVNKEIRESVVFARQDLLTDPPFSKLDLIICRNFLIYLEPDTQEKCIELFHYAVKPGGYLFLGNAETPGRKSLLFKPLTHKKCRIYQRMETEAPSRLSLTVPFAAERAPAALSRPMIERQQSVAEFVQQSLLEESGPPAVAIDQRYDIVYNNGPTNRYLRLPRGAPTHNLLELLPENLGVRIRGAIYRTSQQEKPVSIRAIILSDDGKKRQVNLRVSRLRDNLYLIVFREKGVLAENAEIAALEAAVDETAVRQLESELSASRAELQHSIEQLKSLNEEMQSSNEELQAANEELETSREELQSLNEELTTVNSQLQSKIEEQEETNNDLSNFLSSTSIPTIFLDLQSRIKRFTPAMSRLVKLISADVGRPIADLSQENLGPDLMTDVLAVLENLVPIAKEIAIKEYWYIRGTLPYRTADNRIE